MDQQDNVTGGKKPDKCEKDRLYLEKLLELIQLFKESQQMCQKV